MRWVSRADVAQVLAGRRVALVGSGPGAADNAPGFVDSHEVVIRVNNYKTGPGPGLRTDVFYSFFGSSIHKTITELKADGVRLCINKCPDAKPIESAWHEQNGKRHGIDFRYIYKARSGWWFCDTYRPTDTEFLAGFHLLGEHIPTTGFSALLELLSYEPASIYLTGFDFFQSGVHNLDEPWRAKNSDDPIGHVPARERDWLAQNLTRLPITVDQRLERILA